MGTWATTNMSAVVVASVQETGLTASQFDTIYNVTSFGLACVMASTCFFFLRLPSMTERYKEALCYTGLVTFIAFYHYYRIFNSFDAAFTPCEVVEGVVNPNKCSPTEFGYSPTGHAFNDAYRYMDWLLTVPPLDLLDSVYAPILLHRVHPVLRPQGVPGFPARGCPRSGQVGMLGNRHLVVHLPHRLHPPNDVRIPDWQGWPHR